MSYVTTKTIKFVVTVPANAPANSLLVGANATIVDDPLAGNLTEIAIPMKEMWIIKDIYVKTSPAIDVVVRIKKDRRRVLFATPPVSALLVSNPSRPQVPALGFAGGDVLSIEAINLSAGGASATTVEVYADVDVYSASGQ